MTSEKHDRSKKQKREKESKTNDIATVPAVTDFCTEVRGAFSTLSSAAANTLEPSRPTEKKRTTHDRQKAGCERDQPTKRLWLVLGICAIIVMIVCILVWALLSPASDVTAIPSYTKDYSAYGNNERYYDTNTSINSFEVDDTGNDTSMEYDSVESLLTYLGNYITSGESNKQDGTAEDTELPPDSGRNRIPTSSPNILNTSESMPNAEALRYLAYVPVVIDDEEDNIQHRSSGPRLQQEWRRPPPPNLNVPYSGRPISFKDPKREAFLKASLLRRLEGMRPRTGPIRGFKFPFRQRPSPMPILKGSPTQQIGSFARGDIQHFPPISNQKVSSRNGNFPGQLDLLQGQQSQMQQFSSIQDIIRHIDDRPRKRSSSTSRRREQVVRLKNDQSRDSKRRYSFMMDLYPLGGKVNPMMFTEESRFDENGKGEDPRSRYRNQNRDLNDEKRLHDGYRKRGPSVQYEEEKTEEENEDDYSGSEEETTATESSYAKPKGKGGRNDNERLKFQNYESNGAKIQQREWNPRPRFTIDDIIQILTAAGKIASNRRSTVLPVLPRDVWPSRNPSIGNKWNDDDSSMDLQAVESNQNRLLTKQGYWNSSNRYGYNNIQNHAPEPLPDPEAATVRITSIGTKRRN